MLDVALRNVVFRHREGFTLRVPELLFPKSTHTAIAGPPACGATTLLALIAGTLRPSAGEIIIGARPVTGLKPARRPLLAVTSALDVPLRWSVQHALVAAVRTRSLDRIDRHREYELVVSKWGLDPGRKIASLSSSERTLVHVARIELLRPAILVADRLLEHAPHLADAFYRTLRVQGTTVISAPASRGELALTDHVAVLNRGLVVQTGSAAEIYARPADDAAAAAMGEVNVVPVTIRGNTVESVIGTWDVSDPPFQGDGVALGRPDDFIPATRGEDSDFVFGIEEAGFSEGRWLAQGMLTGSVPLKVALPAGAAIHKGKLIAVRYDPARFTLLPRERATLQPTVPTDVVPALRDSR